MEYKLYGISDALLNEASSSSSKESWNIANGIGMDNGEEYFGWNPPKIDENDGKVVARKRKASTELREEQRGKHGNYKIAKDPLSFDNKAEAIKKLSTNEKGTARMPQWQVEDYGDIHQEIDSSLNLDSDLAPSPYASEAMLAMNSMTVFKQEAPSPTMNEVAQLQLSRHNRQSPTSTQQGNIVNPVNSTMEDNSQNMFSNTINQLLSQTALVNLQNVIDNNNLSTSPHSQDSYAVSSTNFNLTEDCRFQYVLAAATSIATKQNEDTLTYLNQGQSYEIKLKKLGDLSMYRGKLLKSVIRICFHERRLQYMEKEQMEAWQKARPGDRILEVDIPLSYGAFDIAQPPNALNVFSFVWDPTKEVGVYIKVNCISTEFTPKKHGGEKGVPFRIQVETYQNGDSLTPNKRLHAAACQIKVFKLKGADRKHKQDREKIMKRPLVEQEKYQPSYECTVLNDIPNDAVLQTPAIQSGAAYSPESVTSKSRSNISATLTSKTPPVNVLSYRCITLWTYNKLVANDLEKENSSGSEVGSVVCPAAPPGDLGTALHLRSAALGMITSEKSVDLNASCGPEFQKAALNPQKDVGLSQQSLTPQKALGSRPLTPESPEKKDDSSIGENGVADSYNNNQLTQFACPDETAHWLTSNRFEKYLDTFSRFSGSDMLRMSREDLIQICGHADGIRLHNALHLKAIAPKLKLYVCRDNTSVFSAIFLSSHSHMELVKKLCSMMTISPEQVKAIYMEGPHSIHIQLSDDVLQHVEEETMFSLNILQENGSYVLLLKRKIRQ